MDTSFESAPTTPTSKVVESKASAIGKDTFVFRRLEKTAIKDYGKETVVPISSTPVSKFLENTFFCHKGQACIQHGRNGRYRAYRAHRGDFRIPKF